MISTSEYYMQRCLDLAVNALGAASPNPMVGAVTVYQDRIIGEGFHTGCGNPHAEVEAINRVKDHSLLTESTLFVNLEPCNHHGKTPPCTDLIIEKGIKKVVIGQSDPNRLASGGIERLRNHGIEVETGVLESESRWLNRRFNTFHEQKRPYIILKWAQTSDGFMDSKRVAGDNRQPAWITDESCRRLVHKWRAEEDAILAGSRTVLLDNPQLNVRSWAGNDPVRITIDRAGSLTGGAAGRSIRIMDGTIPTIIYTHQEREGAKNLEYSPLSDALPVWQQVLADLYKRKIQSVFIEGGPTLFKSLIEEGYWDEARVFIGPAWFGEGVKAPEFPYHQMEDTTIGNSRLLQFSK
jgi:diaminohydroxyphosphoribosylaminopyrimidine deaminase / 5-amino-6-(5-phosphoribosylamino)uracil reductase